MSKITRPQRSSKGTYRAQAAKLGHAKSLAESVTVRSGYAYEIDPDEPFYPGAAERAEKLHEAVSGPIQGADHRIVYMAVKRVFDICFSAAVLLVLLVPLIIVAVAIKVDDPNGPVFFRQERVGKGGRTFKMYKFRSMVSNAEDLLESLQELNEKDGPVFKITDDPRITYVGKFIRKTSIDEFPQFINVLLGQMSVVGPRPALPREVAQYDDYQRQRLLVKPGITCYWQTRRNRDTIGFDEWVDLDLLYIKQCSVWADFKLIIQTVGVVLTAQGS